MSEDYQQIGIRTWWEKRRDLQNVCMANLCEVIRSHSGHVREAQFYKLDMHKIVVPLTSLRPQPN